MKKALVTGGCGYIGSHTMVDLISKGFSPVSVDSGINSDESCLPAIEEITGVKVKNYRIDLRDQPALEDLIQSEPGICGIIHFAALKSVPESVAEPISYFRNNVESLINALDIAIRYHIPHFIYSSSCTVYGNARDLPVTEKSPILKAQSPYGRSKQIGEMILEDCVLKGLKGISLRYFNPAGAHPSGKMGENPINPPMNLVPIITETAIGKRQELTVYGDNYNTRDGSCIRDYIHIMDLARAHTQALTFLIEQNEVPFYEVFNLGSGTGISVFEAIKAFEKVSESSLPYKVGPRRPGDVPAIYADYTKAEMTLGWKPRYSLEDMMGTAWKWEKYRTLKSSYTH